MTTTAGTDAETPFCPLCTPLGVPDPEASPIETVTRAVDGFSNDFLSVRVDEVRFPDGRVGVHNVIERGAAPYGAMIVPRTGNPGSWRYGLSAQYRYPIGEAVYEFPSGGVEDLEAAEASRELVEELGVEPTSMTRLGLMHMDMARAEHVACIWLATTDTESPAGHVDDENGARTRWVTEAELLSMIGTGLITQSATLAAWAFVQVHDMCTC